MAGDMPDEGPVSSAENTDGRVPMASIMTSMVLLIARIMSVSHLRPAAVMVQHQIATTMVSVMRTRPRRHVPMTALMEAKAFSQRIPTRSVQMASIMMRMAWWTAVTQSVSC